MEEVQVQPPPPLPSTNSNSGTGNSFEFHCHLIQPLLHMQNFSTTLIIMMVYCQREAPENKVKTQLTPSLTKIITNCVIHIFLERVTLPLLTGQQVLGSSERKICCLFFLEEVPPSEDSPFQKLDFLENTPSHGRWNLLLWASCEQ